MGPRSDERGNDNFNVDGKGAALMLQWGRAPMSAEIHICCVGIERSPRASMGPRSDERGNDAFSGLVLFKTLGFNGAALR